MSTTETMPSGTSPLKFYRQQAGVIDQNIAVNAQRGTEIDAAINAIADAATSGKRAMSAEEQTSLVTLRAEKGSNSTLRSTLMEQKAANSVALSQAEEDNEAERAQATAQPHADVVASQVAARASGLEHTPRIQVIANKIGEWGRQLQAVRNFSINGGTMAHLSQTDKDILRPMQAVATGLNTDIGSDGGFLVGQQRSDTILQRAYETGEVLSRVNRFPIGPGSNGMTFPAIDETSRADGSRYGGIASGWLGQGNTLTAGKPKFRVMDLKLRKVGAFVYATDELLNDAIALEGWINKYLPLELKFRAEDAIINGTGANQPLGLLNSGGVITVTRSTASRVLYEDVAAMWSRLWAPFRKDAVWLVDQGAEGQFETLAIDIGTAGVLAPVYKVPGETAGHPYATLYGRPVIPVEYGAALGTTGDIILTNLSEYILIDKGGVEQAVSLHVAFLTDEAVYRFMYRVDGQPAWNSALTPKSGGSTLAATVVLS